MAADDKMDLSHPANFDLSKSPDHRVLYGNNFRVGHTLWDIQLSIGQMDAVADPRLPATPPKVVDIATLVISPANTKLLINLLTQILRDYEAAVSPLNVPEAFVQPVNLRERPKKP